MDILNSIAIGKNKERKSNIEALRLLSMLMVLNLHSFYGYDHGYGVCKFLDFFRDSASVCAVDTFLLISGYFGIKWKIKGFYNLVFQVFFYSFGVYIVAVYFNYVEFTTSGLLSNAKCLYDSWGFITGYLLLYVCSPMLNTFAEKTNTKQLFIYIIILFFAENFICRDYGYLNYGLLYLIRRFLNRTDAVARVHINAHKMYWIVTIMVSVVVYAIVTSGLTSGQDFIQGFVLGYSYAGIFIILQAVFIFLAFAKMTFTNKYINWCASSCLAIFLIHMHPAIKQIGYYSYTETLYDLPVGQHILYLVLLIAGVFFGAILIDKIRILISELFYSVLCKIASCLPQQAISIDTYIPRQIKNLL